MARHKHSPLPSKEDVLAFIGSRAGKVGKRYAWKVPTVGASKTKTFVASGAFPPGFTLDETTGLLTGTPLAAGSYRLKVWVLGDPGTQISKTYTIRIAP